MALAAALCVVTVMVFGVAWRHYMQADARLAATSLASMKRDIELQSAEITALETTLDRNLKASAVEIARLENQMVRVNALGQRLTELSSWTSVTSTFLQNLDSGTRDIDQDSPGWVSWLAIMTLKRAT